MKLWEYWIEESGDRNADHEGRFNKLGSEGWELVGIYENSHWWRFVFKRPKSTETQ